MRALVVLAALLACSLVPASTAAAAGCRGAVVAQLGDARVTVAGRDVRACWARTGRTTVIARNADGPHEQISATVEGIVGGRYVWTSEYFTYAESFDAIDHTLTDARTGRRIVVKTGGDAGPSDVIAMPGALVSRGPDGLRLHPIGAARRTLDTRTARAPAHSGDTLYWRRGDGATRSLRLEPVPAALAPRTERTTRRTSRGRCRIPRGAIVRAHLRGIVVWSRPSGHSGCRTRTGRVVSLGADAARVEHATERLLLLARGDRLDLLDLATARVRRTATAPDLAEVAVLGDAFAFTTRDALRLVTPSGTRVVASGALTRPALGTDTLEDAPTTPFLYWTDADGFARSEAL